MNLISDDQRAALVGVMADMHETFSRLVTAVQVIRTPKTPISDTDEDYDFTYNQSTGPQEFDISYASVSVNARVKYIDKQELDSQLPSTEIANISVSFGVIRLKVSVDDCDTIEDAHHVIVDGFNTNVIYRDRRHGLFSNDYCTFYVQRTD